MRAFYSQNPPTNDLHIDTACAILSYHILRAVNPAFTCGNMSIIQKERQAMGVTISITNQKGGVGKTVTVSSLASVLTTKGYRVLVINLDPQRNLDMVAGKNLAIPMGDTETKSVLHVLKGECSLKEAIVPSDLGDLVRASSTLSQWTGRQLVSRDEFESTAKDELYELIKARHASNWGMNDAEVLNAELQKVKQEYDFILMDTNPSLTLLTLNSLYAADYVLIPAFTEGASLDAIKELWDTIRNIQIYNPEKRLAVCGILITKFIARGKTAKQFIGVYQKLAAHMGTILFDQKIRQSISVSEYMLNHKDLIRFDPTGNTTQDYIAFTEEFLHQISKLEAIKHG